MAYYQTASPYPTGALARNTSHDLKYAILKRGRLEPGEACGGFQTARIQDTNRIRPQPADRILRVRSSTEGPKELPDPDESPGPAASRRSSSTDSLRRAAPRSHEGAVRAPACRARGGGAQGGRRPRRPARRAPCSTNELASRTREIAELQGEPRRGSQGRSWAEAQKAPCRTCSPQGACRIEERERELRTITVERRVQDEVVARARPGPPHEVDAEMKFRRTEKDRTLDAMKRQLEEMKRRMEQGSLADAGRAARARARRRCLGAKFTVRTPSSPFPRASSAATVVPSASADPPARIAARFLLGVPSGRRTGGELWLPKPQEGPAARRRPRSRSLVVSAPPCPGGVDGFEASGLRVAGPRPRCAIALAAVQRSFAGRGWPTSGIAGQWARHQDRAGRLTPTSPVRGAAARFSAVVEAFIGDARTTCRRRSARPRKAVGSTRQAQLDRIHLATSGNVGRPPPPPPRKA
jgi:hypothetical protein